MKLDPSFMAEITDRIKKAREMIEVEKTVEALQACVAGTKMLNKEQIAAAKILLGKVMPDLRAVELTGENGGPVKVEAILIRAVDATNDRPAAQSL